MLLKENDKLESDLKCRVSKELFYSITDYEFPDGYKEIGEYESISGYKKGLAFCSRMLEGYSYYGGHNVFNSSFVHTDLSIKPGRLYIFYSEEKRKIVASRSDIWAPSLPKDSCEIGEDEIQILLRNLTSPSFKIGDDIIREKEKCFIATAACGFVNTNDVIILSHFRDTLLEKYFLGKCFINFYYRISPSIAKLIEKNNFVKSIIAKFFIHPIAKICKKYL